ncbi:GNAT family N-acetyltransferase [Kineosporia sp. NBRC 101731]|uniref:GNAT family N-acetyltransferase n=1 Tax=Kineosporia sp. NBRC 101731 TaxID=3032199 RepID=UPI00249FDC4B|nr:GNAT family N-acetyltransferase [Kineosporia sp. NBRC 101731]GLY29897.1 hypothetical protein Kisp02_32620 [Kineosporia sp. NBRC 101731]
MNVRQQLQELERYYDAVPRMSARTEDFGPLTLFVRQAAGGFPFYARPTVGSRETVTVEHVRAVQARQRELGLAETFEWVAENAPGLRSVVEAAGLHITQCPLLVLAEAGAGTGTGTSPLPVARVLDADSTVLPSAIAAQRLAFAGGTAGLPELLEESAKAEADGTVEHSRMRIRKQATVFTAVDEETGTAVAAGQHNPLDGVTEIVGVGTLPSRRREGHGAAVTSALVADATERGIGTVFLSAADEDVARIYRRLGFRQIGTAMIVE